MKILRGTTEDKKDIVRATNSVIGAQDLANQPLIMYGAWMYEKANEDGEEVNVIALKVVNEDTKEENYCSSISKTVSDSIDTILELYSNEEISAGVPIMIKSKKSKAGRDFYYVDLR